MGEKSVFVVGVDPDDGEAVKRGLTTTGGGLDATVNARRLISKLSGKESAIIVFVPEVFSRIADGAEAALAHLDRDFNFLWVNSAYARRCGCTCEQLIGRNHFDVFPDDEKRSVLESARDSGEALRVKATRFVFPRQGEREATYWDWAINPVKDASGVTQGLIMSLIEVTELIRAREETERLRVEAEKRAKDAEEAERILEALMEYIPVGVTIADWPDLKVRMTSRYGCELKGLEVEPSTRLPVEDLAAARVGGAQLDSFEEAPFVRAMKHGEVVADEEITVERPDGKTVPLLCSAGPILDRDGKVLGGVVVYSDVSAMKSAQGALRVAYEREHRIADVLQRAILPEVSLSTPGLGIVAAYHPALKEAEVGGDFYDVFHLSEGRVAVVIGDVSGKGLDAAVHTAMAKYMLRAYAHESPEPAHVMELLNEAMCNYMPDEMFITVFCGVVDPAGSTFHYANAGHDQPLIYSHSNASVRPLEVTGAAVGIVPSCRYGQQAVALAPSDVLLLYTDGITDARNQGRFFGVRRIAKVLAANAACHERRIAHSIVEAAKEYGGGSLRDDAAVLVVKVKGRNCKA